MNFNNLEEIGHKERARQGKYKRRIFCCTSTACHSAGAGQVHTTLDQAVAACMGDEHEAEVVKTGCMGLCSSGPLVRVDEKGKDPVLYGNITPDLAMHIAWADPRYAAREDVPASVIQEESAVIRAQYKDSGKPDKVVDKIVTGKVEKFYKQACFLEQSFVKDPERAVIECVKAAVAKLGENIQVKR